jgi:hypothetical protein
VYTVLRPITDKTERAKDERPPCEHGHFDCSLSGERGLCSDEWRTDENENES